VNFTSYFGIFLGDREYWGKGVGKKAIELVLSFGFDELKLTKVRLRVRMENISAINLYLNTGFKETGQEDEVIFMEITEKEFLRYLNNRN
jgi:diamine N-acetyltransferase